MKTARFSAIAAALATAALVAPTAAQASLPSTVNSVNWKVRTSWVNYVTNPIWGSPQGSQTRTSSNGGVSTANTTQGQTSWLVGTNHYYGSKFATSTDSGSPRTIVAKGGLDYDLVPHGIDISIKDVKVVAVTSTTEKILVDATYAPASGGATVTLSDVHAFNVSSTGTVTLTATGAQIFNGGTDERSYATGEEFGSVTYS